MSFTFKTQVTKKSKDGLVVYGTATSPTLDLDNEMILFHPEWFESTAKDAFLEEKNIYNGEVPGRMVWNHGRDFDWEDVNSEAEYSNARYYPESKVIGQVISLVYKPKPDNKKFDIDSDESMDYYFKNARVEAVFVITDPEMIKRFDMQEMGVSISWDPKDPEKTRRYIGSGANNVNKFVERKYYLREISLTPNPANTDTFDLAEADTKEVEKFEEPSEASGYEVGDLVEYAEQRAKIHSKRRENGMNYYTLKFADSTMKCHTEFTEDQLNQVKEDKMITTKELMDNFKANMAEHLGVDNVSFEMAGFLWYTKNGVDYMTDFYTQENEYFDLPFEFNLSEPVMTDELIEETEKNVKNHIDMMKKIRSGFNSNKINEIIKSALENRMETMGYKNNGISQIRYDTPKFPVKWTDKDGQNHSMMTKFNSEDQITFYNKPTNISNLTKCFKYETKITKADE